MIYNPDKCKEVCQYICKLDSYKNIIQQDYNTRNIKLLEKKLIPNTVIVNDDQVFYWIIRDKWMKKVYCAINGKYEVKERLVQVFDYMSGINIMLIKASGTVDDSIVWESIWKGTRYSFIMKENCWTTCDT